MCVLLFLAGKKWITSKFQCKTILGTDMQTLQSKMAFMIILRRHAGFWNWSHKHSEKSFIDKLTDIFLITACTHNDHWLRIHQKLDYWVCMRDFGAIRVLNFKQATSLNLHLCMLGNFHAFAVVCWLLIKIIFFQKVLSETLSECQTECRSWSGSKLFVKIISRQ